MIQTCAQKKPEKKPLTLLKILSISFCISFAPICAVPISAEYPSKSSDYISHLYQYKLIWEDNFEGNELDEDNNWTVTINGKGGGNKELQYYRRENISIGQEPESGVSCLIINAKKENYRSKKATSGRLSTQNKMSFKYGLVEARIKLPKTKNGLWPAFWMLGKSWPNTPWPRCGEIDILEMGSGKGIKLGLQNRYFNGACHWGESFNKGAYPNFSYPAISDYSLQEGFHLYTLIWDENSIKMYLDLDKHPNNEPYFEMEISGKDTPDSPARYFHNEFFLIFNLAIGGNFTGIWDINQVTGLKNGDAQMYVDYVRVYQKQ